MSSHEMTGTMQHHRVVRVPFALNVDKCTGSYRGAGHFMAGYKFHRGSELVRRFIVVITLDLLWYSKCYSYRLIFISRYLRLEKPTSNPLTFFSNSGTKAVSYKIT